MIFHSPRSKTQKQQKLVNIAEAHHLWDILQSKYDLIDRVQILENFVHDLDLGLIINRYLKIFKKHSDMMTEQLRKNAIKGPKPYNRGVNSNANPGILNDEFIAREVFSNFQSLIGMLLKALRAATTNDNFRSLLIQMIKEYLKEEDRIVKYIKLKGWIEVPPLYPNIPDEVKERLETGAAFHLWDHLAFRYDNIHQTRIFSEFAYDRDFKLLLKNGNRVLDKQAQTLEKELLKFGIPLPERLSDVVTPPETSELLDDDYMYRILLTGIQGATEFHATSIKQTVINDRIRGLFKKLIIEELDLQDEFVKYGKLKGWLNPVPEYRMG